MLLTGVRDPDTWPTEAGTAIVDFIHLGKDSPGGLRYQHLVKHSEEAHRPVIDPAFRASADTLDEQKEHAIRVLDAALNRGKREVVKLLKQVVNRDAPWPGDWCNGMKRIIEQGAGNSRSAKPSGWRSNWPNLSNDNDFLSWLGQVIQVLQSLESEGALIDALPRDNRCPLRDAVTYCLDRGITLNGINRTGTGLDALIIGLHSIRRTIEKRIELASKRTVRKRVRRVLNRLEFDDSTHSVKCVGRPPLGPIDPSPYALFKTIAEANGAIIQSEMINDRARLKGKNIPRELKTMPALLKVLVKTVQGKRGYWISFLE
jgi:hypothetical protein